VHVSLNSYNIPARVSQLTLSQPWLDGTADTLLTVARNTTVYAQSALLPLAEEPITDPIAGDTIEMGALYSDLQPGRWLIVSGERADISEVSGVQDAELVMLASVKQGVQEMLVTPESVLRLLHPREPLLPEAVRLLLVLRGVLPRPALHQQEVHQ